MRSIIGLFAVSLLIVSPFGEAISDFPHPSQRVAPGNETVQTRPHLTDYSSSVNFKLQCMGCHLENGEGAPNHDVPMMKGFVGNFLKVDEGREFLIQVPGASLSALNNQQLAELLNWMLTADGIAGDSAPVDFKPYTEKEVKTWRSVPIKDLVGHRKKLIDSIMDLGIEIPEAVIP